MGLKITTPITVRYCETDQMGVVHHSRYFPWFEAGRTDFIRQLGLSYRELEEIGLLLPLTKAAAKYITGAKYEDKLEIETQLTSLSMVRMTFSYRVVRCEDVRLLATGSTVHAAVDRSFCPINLKKKYPQLWQQLFCALC